MGHYTYQLNPDRTVKSVTFHNPTSEDIHGFSLHRLELSIRAREKVTQPPPPLTRPAKRRPLPDEFYRDIANAYVWAAANGELPRKALAQQLGKPDETVARWIQIARQRGYLAPGHQGKVTV